MKFINRSVLLMRASLKPCFRNAYILTAAQGSNFCKSAKQAFGLIFRNMVSRNTFEYKHIFCVKVRVAVLDKVTDFLLFLGKLVVTAAVALLSFLYFSGGINTSVSRSAN